MAVTPWAQVGPGDVVIGGDGQEWTVEGIDHGAALVGLRRLSDGTYWQGTPSGPTADVVAPAVHVEQTAIAVATQFLGAAVVSGPVRLPLSTHDPYRHPGVLQAHIAIFHGVTPPATDDLAQLVAGHATLDHDAPTVPHTHA